MDGFEVAEERQQGAFSRALLLSFLASQNRSLFGAKCMVDTLVAMYRSGYSLDDVKLLTALSTIGKLTPILQDILLAWASVVMMTLHEVGVPLSPEGQERVALRGRARPTDDAGGMAQGLRALVLGCIERFLNGETLFRLQLQQSMAGDVGGDPEAGGPSPSVLILQQNSRLAIITLEFVREAGLPTEVPLIQAPAPQSGGGGDGSQVAAGAAAAAAAAAARAPPGSGVDFIAGFLEEGGDDSTPGGAAPPEPPASARRQLRGAAVRLLAAFMGAALGAHHSACAFVEAAARCYCRGWTADELFLSLRDEEFAQSGGVVPIGVAVLPGGQNVSATLFARWLSVVYMSLAQLGVRHPGATEQVGWAWVCSLGQGDDAYAGGTALEAHGIADFVSATLRLAAQGNGREAGLADGGVLRMHKEPMGGDALEGFTAAVGIEDPELARTSAFALIMRQQISLVRMARELVLSQGAQQPAAAA